MQDSKILENPYQNQHRHRIPVLPSAFRKLPERKSALKNWIVRTKRFARAWKLRENFANMNMKSVSKVAFAAVVLANLSSCALLRYKCNREYAAKKGMDDASNGRTSMPGRLDGNSCDGGDYSPSDYSKDYNYGFQQKKNEVCAPATAATWGRADGEAGADAKPQKGKLGMCEDNRLYVLYDKEFAKAFCAPARAKTLGAARASSWQPADFETAFHDCGKSKTLRTAYMSAFKEVVGNLCTVDNAKKSGDSEAGSRHTPDRVRGHLESCANKDEVLPAFDTAFAARKSALDKADADAAAASAAAARQNQIDQFMTSTATATFPFQLRNYTSRCSVAADKTYVQVEVENDYPDQVMIQGYWKVMYFGNDFGKITEDRDQEALLVTGNNRKSFQKMTLPRDAVFCRAEFLGPAS
jgi:hypothetical protein